MAKQICEVPIDFSKVESVADLNTTPDSKGVRYYLYNSSTSNKPSFTNNGYIIEITYNTGSAANIIQIGYSADNDDSVFMRKKRNGGNWLAWQLIYGKTTLTMTDYGWMTGTYIRGGGHRIPLGISPDDYIVVISITSMEYFGNDNAWHSITTDVYVGNEGAQYAIISNGDSTSAGLTPGTTYLYRLKGTITRIPKDHT